MPIWPSCNVHLGDWNIGCGSIQHNDWNLCRPVCNGGKSWGSMFSKLWLTSPISFFILKSFGLYLGVSRLEVVPLEACTPYTNNCNLANLPCCQISEYRGFVRHERYVKRFDEYATSVCNFTCDIHDQLHKYNGRF